MPSTRSHKRVTRSGARQPSPPPKSNLSCSGSKGKTSTKTQPKKNSRAIIAPPTPDQTQQDPSLTRGTRRKRVPTPESEEYDEDEAYQPDPNMLESESERQSPSSQTNSRMQTLNDQPTAPRRRHKRARKGDVTGNPPVASASNIIDDEDLLARLERTISGNPTQTDLTRNDLLDQFSSNATSNFDKSLPTLENYKIVANDWSKTRIAKAARDLGTKATSIPPKIATEARALSKLYKQHKEMLALMGNVTIFTLNKALGELGATRAPDRLRLWQKYSIEALEVKRKMPRRGEKGVLGDYNRRTAELWNNLSDIRKKVFNPPIFYRLSGLPSPTSSASSDEDSDDESEGSNLTTEELTELQVLYDEMVCTAKVAKVYAKVAAGIPEGPSLPDFNRKSLKCVQKLHNQIENEANHMDFGYYFLAASNHAPTEGGSEAPGWCQEFTSHNDMAEYVTEKCNFPTIFAAQIQGLSVERAVANVIGKKAKSNGGGGKIYLADKVKGELAKRLRADMCEVGNIKPSRGFPRGPNPASLLSDKGYPVRMVQAEGSSLPPEVLQLGFRGMNSRRSLWLNDINAGLFKFEKVSADGEANQNEKEDLEEEDLNLDESEWHGLGDDDFGEDVD